MRYYLILNPGSKGGKSRKTFERIFSIFKKHNIDFDYGITISLEDAYKFSVNANKKDYDVIVAVGGDGTINRVINGFYDSDGDRISESSRLGIIYTGTSPDFCKSYDIPLKLDSAIQVLISGNTKVISIGRIIHTTLYDSQYDDKPISMVQSRLKTSYFACCANIGIGASLARKANSGIRKYFGDFLGTFFSLLNVLRLYNPCLFTVNFDGNIKRIEKVFNISFGKTFFIASGIKVNNDLAPMDNRFYAMTIKNIRFSDWLKVFNSIYSGKKIKNDSFISLEYVKEIEIYGNSENPEIEFDGDPAGFLPCRIETAKDTISLICGEKNEQGKAND